MRKCDFCNKQFYRKYQYREKTFCSPECSHKSRVKKVEVLCVQCGKITMHWPARAKTRKYCDMKCKAKRLSIVNKGKIVNISGIPWNKGTKGLVVPWNKGKINEKMRGKNSPNWKGGTRKERRIAMGRLEYKQWRDAVLKRDNYTCQICNVYGASFHVDHVERWADNEKLRYSVDNGRTLCVPCHYYVTYKKKMPVGSRWAASRIRRLR